MTGQDESLKRLYECILGITQEVQVTKTSFLNVINPNVISSTIESLSGLVARLTFLMDAIEDRSSEEAERLDYVWDIIEHGRDICWELEDLLKSYLGLKKAINKFTSPPQGGKENP